MNIKPELVHECYLCKGRQPVGAKPCHPCARQGLVAVCTCGAEMYPDGRQGKYHLLICKIDGNKGRIKL